MISRFVDRYFLEHPRCVGQRYFEHLWFAWRFGAAMFLGACAVFLHGVLPNMHQTTASKIVNELYERLQARHTKTL
ncbi:MAG: DUF6356 family protein [Steroidobacteraceae bacterium]